MNEDTFSSFACLFRICPYYFRLITCMANMNKYQIAKVQSQVLLSICLTFCQFQPGEACESITYKKACTAKYWKAMKLWRVW